MTSQSPDSGEPVTEDEPVAALADIDVDATADFPERVKRAIYRRLFASSVVTSWWHLPTALGREFMQLIAGLFGSDREQQDDDAE